MSRGGIRRSKDVTFLRLSGCSSQISLSTSPLETGGGEAGGPRALPRPVLTGLWEQLAGRTPVCSRPDRRSSRVSLVSGSSGSGPGGRRDDGDNLPHLDKECSAEVETLPTRAEAFGPGANTLCAFLLFRRIP